MAKARGVSDVIAAKMARDATQKLYDSKNDELAKFKGRADEEKRIEKELLALGKKLASDKTKVTIAEEDTIRKELARTQTLAVTEIEHRYAKEGIALKTKEATQSEVYTQEIKQQKELGAHWQSQLDNLTEVEKKTGIINKIKREQLIDSRDSAKNTGEIAEENKESAKIEAERVIYNRQTALLVAEAQAKGKTVLEQLKIEEEQLGKNVSLTEKQKKLKQEDIEYQTKIAEFNKAKLEQDREFELTAANIAAYGGTQLEQLEAQLELAKELGLTEKESLLTHQIKTEQLREQEQLANNIQSTLVSGTTALIKGTGTWADMLNDINNIFLKRCLETLIDMVFQTQLMKIIMDSMGGLFGGGISTPAATPAATPAYTPMFAAEGGIMPGGFTPIKQFAQGDIVTRPTLGMVGEGKYDEAVIPLSRGRSIPVEMKGGGEQSVVNISLSVSAIDAQNTFQFLSKNKGMIASMLQGAMRDNHPMRRQA